MRDIRFNCISGKLEDVGATQACIQFNEWHDRAGLDLHFYNKFDDEVKTISLTKDELHSLALVISATKYVDIPSVEAEANDIVVSSEKRREEKRIKEQMALAPSPLTGLVDYNKLSLLDE